MTDSTASPPLGTTGFARLGDWIRARRRALDMTQEALAERLGYAAPTIQKVERGERRPSRELAERLADVLQLAPESRAAFLALARAAPPIALQAAEPSPAPERARAPLRPPTPALPLIGRAPELQAVRQRLQSPDGRLVTLTGPGGIGKTTLALHLAAWAASEEAVFPDGAAVVALAATPQAAELPRVAAAALSLPLDSSQDAAGQLLTALRDRRLLLVLDNLEHLLGPDDEAHLAALLARLLAEAPGVRLLVTSRERLRLPEEWVQPLNGLALPRAGGRPEPEPPAAVALFLDRARRARADFTADAEQRAAIAAICRRLDGMPLAIELAAAWCRALTPVEIADEIDRALDFLASTERAASPGQRGVRASLERSWRLLDGDERRLLARLAVFHGGCERDAAAAVAGATLPTLVALIDKSLLRHETLGGVTRYTLHELVRQYAREQLERDPAELAVTEGRHTTFYADLLQRAVLGQGVALALTAQAVVERNHENLHAAWARVVADGSAEAIIGMAHALWLLYESTGRVEEGLARFGQAITVVGQRAGMAGATGLLRGLQGYYLVRAGRPLAARPLLAEGVTLAELSALADVAATLRLNLGIAEHRLGAFVAAREQLVQAGELARGCGNTHTAAWVELHLGTLALDCGDTAAAKAHFTAFHAVWRDQGYSVGAGCGLVSLADLARVEGRLGEAAALARQAVAAAAPARDRFVVALGLGCLGMVAAEQGELDEGRYLLNESAELMQALGDRWHLADVLAPLMLVEARRGDHVVACRIGKELLRLGRDGMALSVAEVCYGLALLADLAGDPSAALALLDALEDIPARNDTARRAAGLRARLPAGAQVGAAAPAGAALLPWLEAHCAAAWVPKAPPRDEPAAPLSPAGWVFVPHTGERLSPREVEVLRLLMAGASNRAIAVHLTISPFTAKNHVARVLQKLGVSSRTQAALSGRALGLSPLDSP